MNPCPTKQQVLNCANNGQRDSQNERSYAHAPIQQAASHGMTQNQQQQQLIKHKLPSISKSDDDDNTTTLLEMNDGDNLSESVKNNRQDVQDQNVQASTAGADAFHHKRRTGF